MEPSILIRGLPVFANFIIGRSFFCSNCGGKEISGISVVVPVGSLMCSLQPVLPVLVVFAVACLAPINHSYSAGMLGVWWRFT